jgi:hypothetical protein
MIKQRGVNDCGIAVAAMICNVSYQAALFGFRRVFNPDNGLNWQEMGEGIAQIGELHFRSIRPRYWSYSAAWAVEHPCLLKVMDTSLKTKNWHWCAFEHVHGYIFDPIDGIIPYWRYAENDPMVVKTYVECH